MSSGGPTYYLGVDHKVHAILYAYHMASQLMEKDPLKCCSSSRA